MMNTQQTLKKAFIKLRKTSPTPRLDAEVLLAHALGKTREFILAHPEHQLTKIQQEKYESLIKRRLKKEPVAYILGRKEFYGLDFKVTPDTLIPRPETEMLVEEAVDLLRNMRNKVILIDAGTGSGNIIISIAKKIIAPDSRMRENDIIFFGTDVSLKALRVARHNATKNKVDGKIKFVKSDLLEYFMKNKNNLLRIRNFKLIIVGNLPYLSKKIYSQASSDVKKFEPRTALVSKNYGLDHYENLFKQIKILNTAYNSIPYAVLEFSPEQNTRLSSMTKKYFPQAKIESKKDLAGKYRMARIKFS